jgi:hypothetical protein
MVSLPGLAKALFIEGINTSKIEIPAASLRNLHGAVNRFSKAKPEFNFILLPFPTIYDARFKLCSTNYCVKHKKQKSGVQIGREGYFLLCKSPIKMPYKRLAATFL